MANKVTWYNTDKTVVLQQYYGDYTKDDLYTVVKKSAEMLNSVSHTVHVIIDERKVDKFMTATDMRFLEKMVPPNQGAVVVIVPKTRIYYKEVIGNMGTKIAPTAFTQAVMVFSYEEACQYLEKVHHVQCDGLPANGLPADGLSADGLSAE